MKIFRTLWIKVQKSGKGTKCQKRKRKLRNSPESEKSEPYELVSGTTDYHELHKCKESSLLVLGEGATNKSSGVEEKLYMDGTNLDITERLPADSTDGWEEKLMESESKLNK